MSDEMVKISKADAEKLEKIKAYELKWKKKNREKQVKDALMIQKAVDAKIEWPTDAEVQAEIDRKIAAGELKPIK